MSTNQEQHDITNKLIDDTININDGIEYYPEVTNTDTNGQLTTMSSNYYPSNYVTSLPLLSDSVIPKQQQMSLELTDDNNDNNNNSNIDNKALTRLTNQLPSKLKRPKPKKTPVGPKSRPAFVMKLWNMVNDTSNDQFIKWLPDGKSFIVTNRESFMKFILPKYFKHNNFASFVRQLNMYGWHKVQDVTHESIHSASQQPGHEAWQFENPNFVKDKESLLDNIVRNKSSKEDEEVDFGILLSEFETIKMNQLAIVEDLRRIRSDNQLLWEEHFSAREKHEKQTQALDKIMRFLHQVYGNGSRIEEANNFNFGDLVQATQQFQPQALKSQQQQQQQQQSQQSQQCQPQQQQQDGNDEGFNKPMLMLTNSAHKRTYSDGQSINGPSIQEITSPNIDVSHRNSPPIAQENPAITTATTPASSTTTARSNHHPLVQQLLDNHINNGGSIDGNGGAANNQIAQSPSSLFRDLDSANNQLPLTPSNNIANSKEIPPLSADPNFMENLEAVNRINEEKIQHVGDILKNYTHDKGINTYDDYLPNEDANNVFNMDEYLMHTPQDFTSNNAANDSLFVALTPSTTENNNDLDFTLNDNMPNTQHIGTIDEIVEEPQAKRRKVNNRRN